MPAITPSPVSGHVARDEVSHAAAAAAAMPSSSVMPYTYGLTGVDARMDNISSTALYFSIAIIMLVVLTFRMYQRIIAHMRHLSGLTLSADQQYYWRRDESTWMPWFKKHLLYAPLWKKRHNRELQLSKAINVGTLPGRSHFVLLSLLYISNLIYCAWLDYSKLNKAAVTAEFRGRTGHLSTMNMIALFVLAGRNNPFINLLRVSFDTMNLYHRWIGRLVAIEAIAHTVAWGANKFSALGWAGIQESLQHNAFIQTGTLGTVAMIFMLFHSPGFIRHAFYETFLQLHQVFAFLALIGVLWHAKLGPLPQEKFIWLIAGIWAFDRLFRFGKLIYHNYSKRHGLTYVTAEALAGEATRLDFHMPHAWTPAPGSHVFVYLPKISWWHSHPFSVAWVETNEEAPEDPNSSDDPEKHFTRQATSSVVSCVVAAQTGMTRSLYERAAKEPNKKIALMGFLEGSYGALDSLHSYGTVMMFAGGVGVTHTLRHLQDLLIACENRTATVRRIHFVWTVRTAEQLDWIRPWMDKLLAMPCRREVLQISLFITRPKNPRDIQHLSERVRMFQGRPKANVLIRDEFEHRVGAMAVSVCGPGAFADDVRAGTREIVDQGSVAFFEEAFTW